MLFCMYYTLSATILIWMNILPLGIQSVILTFHFSHFIHIIHTQDLWVLWWYCISVGHMHLGSGHVLDQQSGFLLPTGVSIMAVVYVHMNATCMTAGEMNCTEWLVWTRKWWSSLTHKYVDCPIYIIVRSCSVVIITECTCYVLTNRLEINQVTANI